MFRRTCANSVSRSVTTKNKTNLYMSQEFKITETLQKYYDKVFQDGNIVL